MPHEVNELANKRMKIIVDRTPDREAHARRIVSRQLARIESDRPYIPARDAAMLYSECGYCSQKVWESVTSVSLSLCEMHQEKQRLEEERDALKKQLELQQLEMEVERLRGEKEMREERVHALDRPAGFDVSAGYP